MDSIIEAQHLTRHFGDLVAIDGVSSGVQKGEIFGFLWPNGAGKTTTVRMLTSVLDPTSGTATIEDHESAPTPSAPGNTWASCRRRPTSTSTSASDAT